MKVRQFIEPIRRFLWSFMIAYMIGLHNFWKGEERTAEDINSKIEVREEQSNDTPGPV